MTTIHNKKILSRLLGGVVLLLTLVNPALANAAPFQVALGGTGTTTFTTGRCLTGNGTSPILSTVCGVGGATSTNPFMATYYVATSTLIASQFPYASTTALSATTLCLTGDTCRTTWPTSGAGGAGTVATSAVPVINGIPWWTTTTQTPAKLSASADFQWDDTNKILSIATSSKSNAFIDAGSHLTINGGNGSGAQDGQGLTFYGGSSGSSGNGGDLTFTAGDSLGGAGNGGNLILGGGTANGGGAQGHVKIETEPNNWDAVLDSGNLSANRTFLFPDQAGTFCLTITCNGYGWPWTIATYNGTTSNATTTQTHYIMGLSASSTSQFVYASTTQLSASTGLCINGDCRTAWPSSTGSGLATTSPVSAGNVLEYSSTGAGSAFGIATTTLSGGGPITVSNSPVVIGASGAVLGCTTCVLTSRNVNTTFPLGGGGALSGDLTLTTAFGTTTDTGIGNNLMLYTSAGGVIKGIATSSAGLFAGTQTNGFVLSLSGGVPTWVATSSSGGSGAWPWDIGTYNGTANDSTTTPLWLKNTMVIASTTFFTQASTTMLTNTGNTYLTGLTAPNLVYVGGGGLLTGAATTTLAGGGPITVSNSPVVIGASGAVLGCTTASGTVAGCTAAADWQAFNMKVATGSVPTVGQLAYWQGPASLPVLGTVATGTVSAGSSAITVTAGRAAIGGALAIDCATSGSGQNGCLSSTDWSTFNNKQGALSGGVNGMATAWSGASTIVASGTPAFTAILATSTTATSTFFGPVQISNSKTSTPFFVGTSTTGCPAYGCVQGDTVDGEYDFNGLAAFNVTNAGNGTCAGSGFFGDGNILALASDYAFFGFTNSGWTGSGCAVGNATERPESTIISNPTGDMNFELGSTSAAVAYKWYTNNTNLVMKLNNQFGQLTISPVSGATTTINSSLVISTSSPNALAIQDKYLTNIMTVATASTTFPYNLIDLRSSTSTGPLFAVDNNGHVAASSTTPTLSSCGTSPSLSSDSSDFAGTITVGSVAATACTLTFGAAHSTGTHCVISEQTGSVVNASSYTEGLTGFTYSQTGLTSDKLDYICTGQ